MAIWQDLVSEQGFAHGYHSVRRFVNKLHPSEVKQARVVIITEPGEDYGEFRVMLRSDGDLMRFEINLRRIWSLCVT
jgi:hypothetical protein